MTPYPARDLPDDTRVCRKEPQGRWDCTGTGCRVHGPRVTAPVRVCRNDPRHFEWFTNSQGYKVCRECHNASNRASVRRHRVA